MPTYGAWNGVVQDTAGNALLGAAVTVRRESDNGLASLYSTRTGTAMSNPTTTDANGGLTFYAAPGLYKITATSGSGTRTWRYVPVGIAGDSGDGWTTVSDGVLVAYTNGVERDRINSSGKHDTTGNRTVSGYMRVGSATAPTNTTAGDLTCVRMACNAGTLGTSGRTARFGGTLADTSGSEVGVGVGFDVVPTGTSTNAPRALNMSLSYNSSFNITSSAGTAIWAENRIVANSGTIGTLNGLISTGLIASSSGTALGNVTAVNGISVTPISSFSNSLTATVTTLNGVIVNAPGLNTLTVTSQSGLTVAALSQATNNTHLLLGQTSIPAGNFGIYSATANNSYLAGNLGLGVTAPSIKLDVDGTIAPKSYTVATLPSAATRQGQRAQVTDANATTFMSTVAAGGANIVPVFSNGTNWLIA